MNKEIIDYYDRESAGYTNKRYPLNTISYTQFIFKRRLILLLDFLEEIKKDLPINARILDIGCADGVAFKAIEDRFPGLFKEMVGIDVSPKMIEQATKQNTNPNANFRLRKEFNDKNFDVVLELGVHPFDLVGELKFVKNNLNSGGLFLYDLVGSGALFTKIKMKDEPFIKDYRTYKNYELEIKKLFVIKGKHAYGLFIPKLWSMPSIARILQPIFDLTFQKITPELFHEMIYLLKNNTSEPKA